MQSYILVSSDTTDYQTFLNAFYKANAIDSLDIITFIPETTIGIEEIKKLQKQLLFKPLRGFSKAIVVAQAHLMTSEAQNAFLKTLEEPPAGTYLFLLARSLEGLLPTILSRCKIISLSSEKTIVSDNDKKVLDTDFSLLFSEGINTKLLLAQKIGGSKDTAVVWLEKAIYYLREQLLTSADNQTREFVNRIEHFQETYTIIKTTNVSPRFALEQLFLAVPTHHAY